MEQRSSPVPGLTRRALIAAAAGAAAGPFAARAAGAAGPPPVPWGPVTVFAPPAGTEPPGVKYARMVRLPAAGHRRPRPLVAIFENLYNPVDYAFPVFHSLDDGRRWRRVGAVRDVRTGAKPRWQPFLYTLPAPFAGLPRGALLAAGNSIPDDFSSTRMDVFASVDAGRTWRFVSTVATGGPPVANNGETPVWEPFLLLRRGRLICYYSDQRDPRHGQKLVHQVSTDLVRWGPVVDDQADPVYDKRPGMTTVAPLPDGQWIMTFEDGNNTEVSFGVAYKIARDPERFGAVKARLVRGPDDLVPVGSPTVTWTPAGGPAGTVVVSAGENARLFVNHSRGLVNRWTTVPSVVPRGYSRQVRPGDGGAVLTIGGGPGDFPPVGLNAVQFGADFPASVR